MAESQQWIPDALTKGEPTLAACFAAVVEMQSLLIETVEARKNIAQVCFYGWGISCLPCVEVRAKEIERLWQARAMKGPELPKHRE